MPLLTGTGRALPAAANTRPQSNERSSGFGLFGSDRGRPLAVGATSHSAQTMDQTAGQSLDQKKSSRASKKLAQLASDAFSASRPRRSQLLRRRTFHAGSDVGKKARGAGWCVKRRVVLAVGQKKSRASS